MAYRAFQILMFLLLSSKIHAQDIISLEQAEAYLSMPNGIPENVAYVKDLNNKLPKFVGVWKGAADGKLIELHLNQFLSLPETLDGFKIDKIAGRLLIKDQNSGAILYNTLSDTDNQQTGLVGSYFINDSYVMSFYNKNNTNCQDGGEVYLSIKTSTLVDMQLSFLRSQDIMIHGQCPNFSTYVPILPRIVMLVKQ